MPAWDGERTWSPQQLEDARRKREAVNKPTSVQKPVPTASPSPVLPLLQPSSTGAGAPASTSSITQALAAPKKPAFDPWKPTIAAEKTQPAAGSSFVDQFLETLASAATDGKPGPPTLIEPAAMDKVAADRARAEAKVAAEAAQKAKLQEAAENFVKTTLEGRTKAEYKKRGFKDELGDALVTRGSGGGWGAGLLETEEERNEDPSIEETYGVNEAELNSLIEKQYARNERLRSLGLQGEGVTGPVEAVDNKAEPLSWKAYNALKPKQRAAVDFNTALVQAVNRDMKQQDEFKKNPVGEKQQTVYDNLVDEAFGSKDSLEGRGSDIFAPNTMSLLQSIGFKDTNADLDDFLSLRSAIRAEDLKDVDLQDYSKDPGVDPDGSGTVSRDVAASDPSSRSEYLGKLALGTEELKKKFADGPDKSTFREQLRREMGRLGNVYGAQIKTPNVALGFNLDGSIASDTEMKDFDEQMSLLSAGKAQTKPITTGAFFRSLYDSMANRSDEEVRGDLSAMSPQLFQQYGVTADDFWTYADARISNTRDFKPYGASVGDKGSSKALRSPHEFRKLLGLERIKE